jgi:cell wall-associated NlpC family hydrolase
LAAELPSADTSALTVQARAVAGAQSLASVPAAAAWTLDIPAITVTAPEPEPETESESADPGRADSDPDPVDADPAPPADDAPAPSDPVEPPPVAGQPDVSPLDEIVDPSAGGERDADDDAPSDTKDSKDDSAKGAGDKGDKSAKDKDDEPEYSGKSRKSAKADKAAKAEKSAKSSKAAKSDKAKKAEKKAESSGSAVLEIATRYVGVPYLYGGNTPRGFDCSGFTQYVYGQLGINLPHQSERQRSKGKVVSRSDAKPGDLIWVRGHVSIYAGGNKMIDSARAGTTVQYRKMWQSNPTFIRLVD